MIAQRPTTTATARQIDAHRRQRDMVRASLIACPAKSSPTHRRWA